MLEKIEEQEWPHHFTELESSDIVSDLTSKDSNILRACWKSVCCEFLSFDHSLRKNRKAAANTCSTNHCISVGILPHSHYHLLALNRVK